MTNENLPNGGIWREIVKVILVAIITAALTTYITVQALTKDVGRLEVSSERLKTTIEALNTRLSIIETKADERGPWLRDLEMRLRAAEAQQRRYK